MGCTAEMHLTALRRGQILTSGSIDRQHISHRVGCQRQRPQCVCHGMSPRADLKGEGNDPALEC